jgi:hypothetical protein
MARLGAFDATLEPKAWFDSKVLPEGWFADELIPAPTSGAYTLVADGTAYSYSGNNANLLYARRLVADGATYSYSGNNANLIYNRILLADGTSYIYSGNDATLVYSGGPPPVIEVIGVCGPQVTNVFLFNGVVEPPFPVQRRTS